MADSYFVFGVLALVAMVLGTRHSRRPDDPVPGPTTPEPLTPPESAPRSSPGKGKGKRRKK